MVASNKQLSQPMTAMQRQFQAAKISNVDSIHCGTCGGPRASEDCGADFDEEVKVLGNSQNNPYSNTYNPGWRNQPNFSWREQNNSNQGGNNQRQYSNQRFQSQNLGPQQTHDQGSGSGKKSLEELMGNFINRSETSFKNHEAAIKNLETQMRQMAKKMSERPPELPFSEVLEKMPQYAKLMKEIPSKKRRLSEENDTIELTECSAILQRKLPPKRKDLGSFTLPVNFGASKEVRALCDLGSSVNLMPLSMFERLNVGELKPTMMMLQLADRSIVTPWGVVGDVLDSKIPLILGRPFLATSQAKINVGKGTISLRVADEKITFIIFDLKPKPVENNDIFLVKMMEEWSDEKLKQFFLKEKAGATNKKKKEDAQNDQTKEVYSMSMVVNSEQKEEIDSKQKEEKVKGGCFQWKPKRKKEEKSSIPLNSKLNDCILAVEVACKNLTKVFAQLKDPESAMHFGINPG
ncbi:uncharacterized protein LOC130727097 [Lotus japonicus]|uniref:uncharacterized protein LOC130727097 n=1 Tax=Lotus japonicus TaxID=34305 RepID=UPI002587A0BE|nr:uncharacterized protein LOC130727097 [Lotus japonicus]